LPWILEHILAKSYGWNLEEIRGLDIQDFQVHVRICIARESADKEYQAVLAGATPSDAPSSEKKRVTKVKHLKSGAKTETQTETTRLTRKIGEIRYSKTGKVISFDQPELPDLPGSLPDDSV